MKKLIIYWARRDLRIFDNPALFNAIKSSNENNIPFLPIFILEDYMLEADSKYQFGYPSRLFLSKVIPDFSLNFEKFALVKGKGAQYFIDLSKKFDLEIYVNDDIYIDFYKQIEKLKKNDIKVFVYEDALTINKNTKTKTDNLYSIFTPFKKAVWEEFIKAKVYNKPDLSKVEYLSDVDFKNIYNKVSVEEEKIWEIFSKKREIKVGKHTINLKDIYDYPKEYEFPYLSQEECHKYFDKFLKEGLKDYKNKRDYLWDDGTSKMSLGLAWGLISSRILKQKVIEHFDNDYLHINWFKINEEDAGPVSYLSELIWREFYKYLLYHNPNLMNEEFQEKFKFKIEWVEDKLALKLFIAWIKGETGYKIVDAAMKQLNQTGWMHNRARMIVASILTKNLGVDWRWGQEYFREALIDLDEASNNGGWQWGASVGADPKPIRIFNPYLQAENYDKEGIYQKKWLGEEKYFFEEEPIVDHKLARVEALKRYGLDNKGVRDY